MDAFGRELEQAGEYVSIQCGASAPNIPTSSKARVRAARPFLLTPEELVKFAMMAFNAGNGRNPADVYQENLWQARYAEELGFDAVWLTEHHFSDYALLGDPTLFAAVIAERTERIRIGTAVMVLPVHNPIRVAENGAFVDILSAGRFDLGVGRGYQPKEFEGFQVPMDRSQDILDESLEVIRRLWTQETVDFEGEFYQLHDVRLLPRPVQDPHPPVWLAAVSPKTFEVAGAKGQAILTSPNFTPIPTIEANFDAYRAALTANAHDPLRYEYPVMQQVYVGADHDAGYERPREHAMRYYESLGRLLPKEGDIVSSDYEFYKKVERNVADLRYENLYRTGVSFGSSEEVVARIQNLADVVGMTYFIGWFNFGGLPHREVVESMERFASEVMPHFAGQRAGIKGMV
jgi:natural product biosynthesis luciferase-like monooxygenase protein